MNDENERHLTFQYEQQMGSVRKNIRVILIRMAYVDYHSTPLRFETHVQLCLLRQRNNSTIREIPFKAFIFVMYICEGNSPSFMDFDIHAQKIHVQTINNVIPEQYLFVITMCDDERVRDYRWFGVTMGACQSEGRVT